MNSASTGCPAVIRALGLDFNLNPKLMDNISRSNHVINEFIWRQVSNNYFVLIIKNSLLEAGKEEKTMGGGFAIVVVVIINKSFL